MRILVVSTTMGRGGAEMQVRDCAVRLARRGHDVMVVSLLPFEDFESELIAAGVKAVTLGMVQRKASALALGRLVRLTLQFQPDVVHAHMFAAIFASRLARALLSVGRLFRQRPPAIIGTTHTPFEASSSRYLAYRWSDRFSDMWTCVCQEGVDTHVRHGAIRPGTGLVTANGIDLESFRPSSLERSRMRKELGLDESVFAWLAVGSFRDEAKDYGNLLRAFRRVLDWRSSVRLLVAGSGRLLEEKKALARHLGLAPHVDFLGLRSDVSALMQGADAFVMASAWEAMPVVLLEACASGLPPVVTNVGQNMEIVPPGTGHVVPSKDDVALASAMIELMALDSSERSAMGGRARDHVAANFDLERIVDAWELRYREAVARGSR